MPTNKFIISFVCYALTILFVSCQGVNSVKSSSVEECIEMLVNEYNAVEFNDETLTQAFTLYFKKSDKEKELVYVLNSSCSDCIADFCSFVMLAEKCAYRGSIGVVVHEEDIPTIQFYTQKILPDKTAKKLYFLQDLIDVKDIDTEYYNHCVIYRDGNRIKAIRINI